MKSANELEYPYSPNATWRLAVSRRFGVERVDALYADVIRPVLQQEGIVLECRFAGESTTDFDFWMNRMSLLLELADIHILLNVEPSASVKWEVQRSGMIANRAIAPTLMTHLGWAPFSASAIFHPIRLVINSSAGFDRRPRSFLRGPATLHLRNCELQDVQKRLTHMIRAAKKQRLRVLLKAIAFFDDCSRVLQAPMSELESILTVMTDMARTIVEDEGIDGAIDQATAAAERMVNWTPDLEFLNERKKWELRILNGEIELHNFRETWNIMTEYMRVIFSRINPRDVWTPYMTIACSGIGAFIAFGMYRCARDSRKLAASKGSSAR